MHKPKITTFTRRSLLAGAMLSFMGASLPAAIVTWGTPQQITGDVDVSTNGALVAAFNLGDTGAPTTTVNGVVFQGFPAPLGDSSSSVGNFSLSAGADIFLSDNTAFGSTSAPFTGLSAGYKALLTSAALTAQPTVIGLTMSGLTFGQTYEFQWWANTSGPATASTLHSAVAGTSVTLNDNTSGLEGGLGQYVTGIFVADGTSQTISFGPVPPTGPNSSSQLNAFQLRQVPEPSSVGLLGLAMITLGVGARCRRKG